jgi:hypothetical protein
VGGRQLGPGIGSVASRRMNSPPRAPVPAPLPISEKLACTQAIYVPSRYPPIGDVKTFLEPSLRIFGEPVRMIG